MANYITSSQLNQLNNMADELKDNFDDIDKTNGILKNMLAVLGEKPMFESTEDFMKFMESDEPLVF